MLDRDEYLFTCLYTMVSENMKFLCCSPPPLQWCVSLRRWAVVFRVFHRLPFQRTKQPFRCWFVFVAELYDPGESGSSPQLGRVLRAALHSPRERSSADWSRGAEPIRGHFPSSVTSLWLRNGFAFLCSVLRRQIKCQVWTASGDKLTLCDVNE